MDLTVVATRSSGDADQGVPSYRTDRPAAPAPKPCIPFIESGFNFDETERFILMLIE